jgi:hypothetical protein
MCGFLSWARTSVLGYNFSTAYSPTPVDAVAAFVAAARARRAPVGMYYSLTNNARTNTCAGQILPNPGANQIAVTPAQYDALVVAHLTELWGDYGQLDEIWCAQRPRWLSSHILRVVLPSLLLLARLLPPLPGLMAALRRACRRCCRR